MTDALYWYLSSYDMINPIIIEIEVNGAFEKWTIGKQWYICIYVLYNYFKKKNKVMQRCVAKAFYHFEFLPFSIKYVSSMSMFGFTGGRCSWGGRRGRFSGKMQIWS